MTIIKSYSFSKVLKNKKINLKEILKAQND